MRLSNATGFDTESGSMKTHALEGRTNLDVSLFGWQTITNIQHTNNKNMQMSSKHYNRLSCGISTTAEITQITQTRHL